MNNFRRDFVGLIATCGFCAVCILMLRGGVIDSSLKDVALVLMGQLAAKFGTVVDYHYGASAKDPPPDKGPPPHG